MTEMRKNIRLKERMRVITPGGEFHDLPPGVYEVEVIPYPNNPGAGTFWRIVGKECGGGENYWTVVNRWKWEEIV